MSHPHFFVSFLACRQAEASCRRRRRLCGDVRHRSRETPATVEPRQQQIGPRQQQQKQQQQHWNQVEASSDDDDDDDDDDAAAAARRPG